VNFCTKRFRGNVWPILGHLDVERRAGADQILNGVNHGPFGQKNFFVPDGHWPYGPSRAMPRLLPVAGHAVNHVWAAHAVLAAWI
jgi:hypothetical protein